MIKLYGLRVSNYYSLTKALRVGYAVSEIWSEFTGQGGEVRELHQLAP